MYLFLSFPLPRIRPRGSPLTREIWFSPSFLFFFFGTENYLERAEEEEEEEEEIQLHPPPSRCFVVHCSC